ncbi:unnamed protein product, partial [Cyprideis torosa]
HCLPTSDSLTEDKAYSKASAGSMLPRIISRDPTPRGDDTPFINSRLLNGFMRLAHYGTQGKEGFYSIFSCLELPVDGMVSLCFFVLEGPIAPAVFDLRQGSLCARESEIVSLLQRESFHRGRVSTEMIKGGVCLPMIPRMRSVSEAANRTVAESGTEPESDADGAGAEEES